jgi:tRNA(fMet)-specific endonuclease VapC
MRVLVDTDILSELQRNVNPNVRARARAYELAQGPLTLSVLTVFEVLQGWLHRGRTERAETFLRWMVGAEVLPFDFESARLAANIGSALLRAGRPIGLVDVGLAATAIVHGRTLVTGNTAHFDFVRAAGFELPLENWREPA